MITDLLAQIPPFDFLSPAETAWLEERCQEQTAVEGTILCDPGDQEYDDVYIVSAGRLAIYLPGAAQAAPHQVRSAPTYFGEISVFFNQPRNARVTAYTPVQYYQVPGKDLRALIQQNPIFRQAFASVLQNKQRIFYGFDTFVSLLTLRESSQVMQIQEMIEAYRGLHSVLHQAAPNSEIDFDALAYVLPRLPDHISSLFALELVEDLPEMFTRVGDMIQAASQRAKKRRFYELLPGKNLVLLRDRLSDTVDLVTKLCIYSVETEKIRNRLRGHPMLSLAAEMAVRGSSELPVEDLKAELPFSTQEMERLQSLLGGDVFARLYEILVQDGQLTLYFQPPSNRYEISASEQWRSQIRDALVRMSRLSGIDITGYEVHIISSNTHSVSNCLSAWLKEHSSDILKWAEINAPDSLAQFSKNDQLYAASRPYFQSNPEALVRKSIADEGQGIFTFDDTSFAGISVTLIDASQLRRELDPLLEHPSLRRPTLIVNIDYAYGRQAQLIIQNLVMLFGQQIRSVSVFGKCGGIVGRRGDILLPNQLILQTRQEVYPIPHSDLSCEDFEAISWTRDIHQGSLLTVLGTVMQSSEMLHYYRIFWNVIGMEMEGSFYLHELLQAQASGMIAPDVNMRFAYYVSDTPLEAGSSLATKLSPQEGIPAVYAITRAILRKILSQEERVYAT